MLRWAPYPFVRITLSFIAGILLYIFSGKELGYAAELFAFFMAAFAAAVLIARKRRSVLVNNLAGILGLVCFFTAGIWLANWHNERNNPLHLQNLNGEPAYYTGTVSDYVLQKTGYQSTVLSVDQVLLNGTWQEATGKVQLSVPDDSAKAYLLSYGDQLLVKGAPQLLAAPANPHQFDYKSFLANKNIYHRHYLQAHQYQKIGFAPSNYLLHYSIQLRRKLDALLREQMPDRREYGISSALVLGVKDEVDNSIRDAYAGTGTMHVLAVSGLHVGLIYLLLMTLLGRFRSSARQRVMVAALLLAVLWGYALMTGLSPSVLRAAVMFSIVTLADASTRRHNIYNTIAFAAFVLLCYNPYYLLEVSFQLSFLAVLGIVYLQPRFSELLHVENKHLNTVWGWFTVSVAAQLATLPLGIYYFNQFPVYFWLANLFIVPAATIVLYLGVAALVFNWLPFIGALLFKFHFWLIWGMNEFNLWLTRLPNAIINGLTITQYQAWLLYGLILLFILFFASRKLRFLVMAVSIVGVFSLQEVLKAIKQQDQQIFAVYNMRGNTAVTFVQNQQASLLGSPGVASNSSDFNFNIRPHLWRLGVQGPVTSGLYDQPESLNRTLLPDSNSIVVWNNLKILLLSKPPHYLPSHTTTFDYLVLSNSVRLKPEDLKQLKVRKAIFDTSNAPWHVQRLKPLLDGEGIPYYDVAESGAYVLELK